MNLFFRVLVVLVLLYLVINLVSCQTPLPDQVLNPQKTYRRDLTIQANGVEFTGTGVPKKADTYKLVISSPTVINMLRATSCHRDVAVEAPEGVHSFNWLYRPVIGLEDGLDCILDITAYGKDGKHAFGSLDFESPKITLKGHLNCNGDREGVDGTTTMCESRQGLTQRIAFDVPVKADPDGSCKTLSTTDQKTFTYPSPRDECTYFFCSQDGRCHKHTAFGYEDIPLRGN